MDMRTMLKSLNIYWIQRMEWSVRPELPDSMKPGWVPLARDIILHEAPEYAKVMCQYPWRQQWGSVNHTVPQSLKYFWERWVSNDRSKGHRIYPCTPKSAKDIDCIEFWFHPQIQGRHAPRWGAPIWRQLYDGIGGVKARTLGDLRLLEQRSAQNLQITTAKHTQMKMAITRLFRCLPSEWKTVWPGLLPVPNCPTLLPFEHCTIYSHKTKAHLTLQGKSKTIYQFLVADKRDTRDLLSYAKNLVISYHMKINDKRLKKIWKTIAPKEATWYPKFTDLAWCISLNKVHTGERWMTKYNCPNCLVPQVMQHLFWECPLAQAVWNKAGLVWQRILFHSLNIGEKSSWLQF